jgi:hypothetical protein
MAKLVWDKTGERIYETGVDRMVLYKYDNQTKQFNNATAWNGVTAFNESPSGAEPTALWADNIKYLNLMSAEEYGATLEAYTYPDAFEECDGSKEVAPGVYIGQQNRKLFGLCYRTLLGNDVDGTDLGYKIHIVYNCLASPSERDHGTVNDSPEAANPSWEISTTPVEVTGGKPTASVTIDSTKVDAAKLAAFEDIIYGTAQNEPRLPFPDEIAAHFGGSSTPEIELDKHVANITGTGTVTLNVKKKTPDDAVVTWTENSSSAVCTVSDGVVTGVAAGDAIVTATITVDGVNYTDTCTIVVVEAA